MTSMWNSFISTRVVLWKCQARGHAQAFSVEPVAALISRLVKPDGGRLLLADPLERTRKHRWGCMYSIWGSCTAGQLLHGT